jgi:hypothetical protein
MTQMDKWHCGHMSYSLENMLSGTCLAEKMNDSVLRHTDRELAPEHVLFVSGHASYSRAFLRPGQLCIKKINAL